MVHNFYVMLYVQSKRLWTKGRPPRIWQPQQPTLVPPRGHVTAPTQWSPWAFCYRSGCGHGGANKQQDSFPPQPVGWVGQGCEAAVVSKSIDVNYWRFLRFYTDRCLWLYVFLLIFNVLFFLMGGIVWMSKTSIFKTLTILEGSSFFLSDR